MTEQLAHEHSLKLASNALVHHFYPVLGVLNSPGPSTTPTNDAVLSPYARQVSRSILKYLRGNPASNGSTSSPFVSPKLEASQPGSTDTAGGGNEGVVWDAVGSARATRWQAVGFGRVDDIPRRKAYGRRGKEQLVDSSGSGVGKVDEEEGDLSPRSAAGEGAGEGLLSARWMAKQQRRRPATIVSFHSLGGSGNGDDRGGRPEQDAALVEEIARNRVCIASYGLSYTAVVIINRALADDPGTEGRLAGIMQGGGLDALQFCVCRPGTAQQFQVFLTDLGRKLFAKAAVYYADAFMRTQTKLAAIPQLPVSSRPDMPGSVYQYGVHRELAAGASADMPSSPAAAGAGSPTSAQSMSAILADPVLISRFSRHLPLRAWLVRYHFKMAMFAEAVGDRDTAQRCLWIAYVHLMAYISEIASGAYLPPDGGHGGDARVTDGSGAPVGWMWLFNGGDPDGTRSHSLRMFGRRWDEAVELFEAVHLRLVRGWMYQSIEAATLRLSRTAAGSGSGGWPYGFGGGSSQQSQISAVNRSGIRAVGRPAVNVSPGGSASQPTSALVSSVAGGNGSLEALVLSVHAGECTAATEQLMDMERRRRHQRVRGATGGSGLPVCFVALGSETADVDLVQPEAAAHAEASSGSGARWWWPLGGHFGVLDFARSGEPSKPGLVINNTLETTGACSMLPASSQYDVFLTLAARQCSEHVLALALVLKQAGFGDRSSYFWATVGNQYSNHAALQILAGENRLSFAKALDSALTHMTADTITGTGAQTQPGVKSSIDQLVGALRQPLPKTMPALLDRLDAGPAKPAMDWKRGRPRAASSAFAGFAFDQALGGIYAVVDADKGSSGGAQHRNAGTHDRSSLQLDSSPGSVLAAAGGIGVSGVRDCVFPHWLWSENAAPLLHSAALAALRRFKAFAAERNIYMSNGRGGSSSTGPAQAEKRQEQDSDGSDHCFSAYPGVENTYVAIWLVAERSRNEGKDVGLAAIRFLATALTCIACRVGSDKAESSLVSEAAREAVAQSRPSTLALQRLCTYRGPRDAEYLYLASELAEVFAELGEHAVALSMFGGLVRQFRAEGWVRLTSHALQWIVKCAGAVDDPPSTIEATVELLSPQLVASDAERRQVQEDLRGMLSSEGGEGGEGGEGCMEIEVDMHAIYSPVTCHAHWRHWQLGSDSRMAYQIVFDCRTLQLPMPLNELSVVFSDPRFSLRIVREEKERSGAESVLVAFATSEETASYLRLGAESSFSRSVCLEPGRMIVVEAEVVLDEGYSEPRPAGDLLAIQSVTATVGSNSGGWKMRMCWPTCVAQAADQASSDDAGAQRLVDQPADGDLSAMERRLLGNIGVARMHDLALGESSQLVLDASIGGAGQTALRRSIRVSGPAASLAQNRRWLCVSPRDGRGRWVQLPVPPLTPRKHRQVSDYAIADGGVARSVSVWTEPAFSAYSRCRTLYLAEPAPAVALSAPSVAQLAPAYRGEVFPVELRIDNLHRKKPLARISVEITVAELDVGGSMADSVGFMDNVGSGAPSARMSAAASMVNLAASEAGGDGGAEASASKSGLGIIGRKRRAAAVATRPWLSNSLADDGDDDDSKRDCDSVVVELRDIEPGQSLASTVYVHFPAPMLSSAWRSGSAGGVALVKATAHYSHESGSKGSGEQQWTGSVSLQVSVPVVNPLHAQAEQLPSHVAAPRSVPLPTSSSIPAAMLGGDGGAGEYCLRRPLLVSLYNSGPWDVAIERMALRPPLIGDCDFRVQLAGSTASACAEDSGGGPAMVVAAGGYVQHVFWLDVYSSDLVRLPEDICPGTLEVCWRRRHDQREFGTMYSRMWMRPMRLMQKQVQAESECSMSVAKVGQPVSLFYRILNPTRETKTVETAMHASECFVFAGPRRTTLNILPGHVGLLRFNLVPITAVAQPSGAAGAGAGPGGSVAYSPGPMVFGLRQQVAALTAQGKPMPPSNVAGQGWVMLPKLDIKLADRHGSTSGVASSRAQQQSSSSGPSIPAPPPTRSISATAVANDGDGGVVDGQAQLEYQAQKLLVALAGLDVPGDDEDGPMAGMLSSELIDECLDIVPEYLLRRMGGCQWLDDGAESDIDDADDVECAEMGGRMQQQGLAHRRLAASKGASALAGDNNAVLRFDQSSIFCVP